MLIIERNSFLKATITERNRIERLIELSNYNCADRGSLYIQRQGERTYVYERWQKKGGHGRKKYLGSIDSDSVRELFSLRFNEEKMIRLRENQKLMDQIQQQYLYYDFESILADMPKAYRIAGKSLCIDSRYEEIRKWAQAPYTKNSFPFPAAEIYAKDGTRLRSKGECIWYNLLQERGILFRTDCEVNFVDQNGNQKTLYPDFLIKCLDGTLIIVEHLGRMGDMSYAMGFGERSYWYFQKGFILGKNYFVSSDDMNYGTDSQMIFQLIDRIEAMFYGF
ncbi:MAG: hypothetical protein IJV66_05130 [Firmicutes bacterium]|nr:hypothetical protein [Bacillota bacterium]